MNLNTDVIIVGGGLFGQIINCHLNKLGMSTLIIDANMPLSGSKPAACLMKPSWFSSLGKEVYEPSLRLLDENFGVHDLEFKTGPTTTSVHWCNPAQIMGNATPLDLHIHEVGPCWVRSGQTRIEARTVVVAAGVWSNALVPVPGLTGRAGAAFLWPFERIETPFIRPWAPYRQLVAFNRGDGLWVGDGTAIKLENFTNERLEKSAMRCANAVGTPVTFAISIIGIRPYVPKVKPCYLSMEKGLIVATGGAKNGTLAAGWCAHKIGEYLS